jgi:large subunit ribosomal protein L5
MTQTATDREMPRLKTRYRAELEQRLKDELELGNIMQVPRPLKVVVNMGIGEAIREARLLDGAVRDLTQITGQKPLVTKAKKSIAGFKIREGQSIGAKVTLPRIRDFRGLNPRTFDGHGNFTFGLTEQLVFPEIDYDKIEKVRGMDITVVTSAETDEQGRALLTALGFPFRQS